MLGFNCDCSDDSGTTMEGWETYWKTATSRPNVWCDECGRWIRPGETYYEGSGVSRDDVEYTEYLDDNDELHPVDEEKREYFDTCVGCRNIAAHFCSGGYILGQLAEQVQQCLGFYYPKDDEDEEDWEDEELAS